MFIAIEIDIIFLPRVISNKKTPKLKKSDFSENQPFMAYSGEI